MHYRVTHQVDYYLLFSHLPLDAVRGGGRPPSAQHHGAAVVDRRAALVLVHHQAGLYATKLVALFDSGGIFVGSVDNSTIIHLYADLLFKDSLNFH